MPPQPTTDYPTLETAANGGANWPLVVEAANILAEVEQLRNRVAELERETLHDESALNELRRESNIFQRQLDAERKKREERRKVTAAEHDRLQLALTDAGVQLNQQDKEIKCLQIENKQLQSDLSATRKLCLCRGDQLDKLQTVRAELEREALHDRSALDGLRMTLSAERRERKAVVDDALTSECERLQKENKQLQKENKQIEDYITKIVEDPTFVEWRRELKVAALLEVCKGLANYPDSALDVLAVVDAEGLLSYTLGELRAKAQHAVADCIHEGRSP